MVKLSRRGLIKAGLFSGSIITLPIGVYWLMRKDVNPRLEYFQRSLIIPPILSPVRQDATADYYEITVQQNWVELLSGLKTESWGYNGITPGPTIRQKKGRSPSEHRESVIRFINQLAQDSQGEPQLIDRNGAPPCPYERGWKDTFFLGERETLRTIVRFPSRDGQPVQGTYMMHCHNLDHEDNAIMIQFGVGKNGPDPVTTAPAVSYASVKNL
jgi:FtsP/CotA-like multicopper oxidase with cupredoxin domain